MANFICAFLLLSMAIMTKADFQEEALNYIQIFAEQTSKARENIEQLQKNFKPDLHYKLDELKVRTKEESMLKIVRAKEIAKKYSCQKDFLNTQLDAVHAKIESRWDNCVNFTMEILQFSKYLFDTGAGLEVAELLVCDATQNVSRCSGNFLDKWHCITTTLGDFIQEVSDHGGNFIKIIEKYNEKITEIIRQATKCFVKVNSGVNGHIQQVMLKECGIPVSNEDLLIN